MTVQAWDTEWHLDAQEELHLIALFQISAGHISPVQIDPRSAVVSTQFDEFVCRWFVTMIEQ